MIEHTSAHARRCSPSGCADTGTHVPEATAATTGWGRRLLTQTLPVYAGEREYSSVANRHASRLDNTTPSVCCGREEGGKREKKKNAATRRKSELTYPPFTYPTTHAVSTRHGDEMHRTVMSTCTTPYSSSSSDQ